MVQIIIFLASAGILLFDMAPTTSAKTMSVHQELGSGVTLTSKECKIRSPEEWTEPEKWAWREICEGRNADFNWRFTYLKEKIYPKEPQYNYKWLDEQRVLSSGFLRTILLSQPFRSAIQRQGVHIIGAHFQDEIRLENAIIERPLIIEDSVFEEPVFMSRLKSLAIVSFNNSEFQDDLNMDFISTEASIFMDDAYFAKVYLTAAKIKGHLVLDSSIFKGDLNMDSISTEGSIFMRNANFADVDLTATKIGGELNMDSSTSKDYLNMDSISTEGSIFMRNANFADVGLTATKIGGELNMDSSTFKDYLNMDSISTKGSAFMQNAYFADVNLTAAKIGGELNMNSSTFKDYLNMDSISTESSIFMRNAYFADVNLTAAKIGGELNMNSSTFKNYLNMDSISTKGSAFMQNAYFADVNLTATKIGGELNMDSSTFKDEFTLSHSTIRNNLTMDEANFEKETNMTFLDIGSNLFIRGGSLWNLDLTGARIKGELVLGSSDSRIKWRSSIDEDADSCCNPPRINLRNTVVGILQDTKDSWPDNLKREFDGFTYAYLGGVELSGGETPYTRGVSWFKEWLDRDESYSPQPYNHLAKILSTSGHRDMANEILYTNREHQRAEYSPRQPKWWFLSALKVVIGHGYKYLHTLYCAIFLVIVGYGTLKIKKEVGKDGKRLGFWYSLDMLLPVIRLREEHYKKDIETWVKYYFYCHKILGYVLVLFLIAGLTGLAK